MRKIANLNNRAEGRKDSPGLCIQLLFQLTTCIRFPTYSLPVNATQFEVFKMFYEELGQLAIKRGLRSPGKLEGLINNIHVPHFTHGVQNADLSSVLS